MAREASLGGNKVANIQPPPASVFAPLRPMHVVYVVAVL